MKRNSNQINFLFKGLLLFSFCLSVNLNSQVLFDGSFNKPSFSNNTKCNRFNRYSQHNHFSPFQTCDPSPILGWLVANGTPQIFQNSQLPDNGGNGNDRWLLLWSGRMNQEAGDQKVYGEGVFTICNTFTTGKEYTLKFQMDATAVFDSIQLRLTNSHYFSYVNGFEVIKPTTFEYPNISDYQVIFNKVNFISQSGIKQPMEEFTITFTPNKDYDALWIYVYAQGPDGNDKDGDEIYFDDFVFPECPISFTFTAGNQIIENNYHAQDFILFQNSQKSFNSSFIARAGRNITVEPLSGFEVNTGVSATFEIEKCANNDLSCESWVDDVVPRKTSFSDENISDKSEKSFEFTHDNTNLQDLNIYNISGELIIQLKNLSDQKVIDEMEKLPRGFFIIHIITPHTTYSEKLAKM